MYILIYINCTERVWGMHVRRNYPPCIRRRNKECLPFNTTLVLRGLFPDFRWQIYPGWAMTDQPHCVLGWKGWISEWEVCFIILLYSGHLNGWMDEWIRRWTGTGIDGQSKRVRKSNSYPAWRPVTSGHCRWLHLSCTSHHGNWGFPLLGVAVPVHPRGSWWCRLYWKTFHQP